MDEQTISTDASVCYRCVAHEQVDSYGHSETLICTECGLHVLAVNWPDQRVVIPLTWLSQPWEKKPGESNIAEATELVAALLYGEDIHPLARLRYGLNTPDNCDALGFAVARGVTAYDLNRVRCDGWAIRRLVESVPEVAYSPDFVTWFDQVQTANSLSVAK